MKKIICLILALLMIFSVVSCTDAGKIPSDSESSASGENAQDVQERPLHGFAAKEPPPPLKISGDAAERDGEAAAHAIASAMVMATLEFFFTAGHWSSSSRLELYHFCRVL